MVGSQITMYTWALRTLVKMFKIQYTNLASGDYSIAKITSSLVTPSNLVMSDYDFYAIKGTRTLPVGAISYRYGTTTGLGAVEVTATGLTIHDGAKYIRGMIEATYVSGAYAGGGDSGGPLYAMNSSSKCVSVGCLQVEVPQIRIQLIIHR